MKPNPHPSITAEYVRSVLDYNPETGLCTWKKRVANCIQVGDAAGSMHPNGYWVIGIKWKVYALSRVIYLWMTGSWPPNDVDHRDLDKSNHRWINLRPATMSQNRANTAKPSNNTSGHKGVVWHKRDEIWEAAIGVKGRLIYLGRYDCIAAAVCAYAVGADKHFGAFARAD